MLASIAVVCAVVAAVASPVAADPLDDVHRVMTATPVAPGRIDLAVHSLAAGHVALANRAGDRFTASLEAKGDEIARALATLVPEAASGSSIRLYLSPEALFDDGARLPAPLSAKLMIANRALRLDDAEGIKLVIDGRTFPVRLVSPAKDEPRSAAVDIAPNVSVHTSNPRGFLDLHRLLTRPLRRADLRVIALTPGAPAVLSVTPRLDTDGKTALVDAIDPMAAATIVGSARNQVLIFTGSAVPWSQLVSAAAGRDVILVHLDTGSTTQPGGRNFLWLPVRLPLQRSRSEHVTLLDLLSLSVGNRQGLIRARADDGGRVGLDLAIDEPSGTQASLARWRAGLDRLFAKTREITHDLIGSAAPRRIAISLPTSSRQAELDRRFIKSVPAVVQYAYPLLLLIGLVGLPVARSWFARVWPPEQAADYPRRGGWTAARAVRAGVFAMLFLPVTAPATALLRLFGGASRATPRG